MVAATSTRTTGDWHNNPPKMLDLNRALDAIGGARIALPYCDLSTQALTASGTPFAFFITQLSPSEH